MRGYTATEFGEQALRIQTALSQSLFNQVNPTPAEVTVVAQQLLEAEAQCRMRNFFMVPQRNAFKKQLREMLLKQVACVNVIAQNNLDVLRASEFELGKARSPRPLPLGGRITSFKPTSVLGSALLRFQGFKNHILYQIEVVDENGNITYYSTTENKYTVVGANAGGSLKARVRGTNKLGAGEWSDTVECIVPGRVQQAGGETNNGNLKVA